MTAVNKVLAIIVALTSSSPCSAQTHSFNVRDGIEMSTFSEPDALTPDATAPMSPDRKYSVLVTSHGELRSNEIQSHLYVIPNNDVSAYLQVKDSQLNPPRARLLAVASGSPDGQSYIPYSPVITDIRWSLDSHTIFFLAARMSARRQLCAVNIESRKMRILTPPDKDVERYSFVDGVVVYTATHALVSETNKKITGPEVEGSVTGLRITRIIFPQTGIRPLVHELWCIRHGRSYRLDTQNSSKGQLDLLHYWDVLSISPNGRYVVQIKPVNVIPSSWEAYIPEKGKEDWKIDSRNPKFTSPDNIFRARQYVLTDLANGKAHPLIDAPYGDVLAYIESFEATWSHDSNQLIVTNTFLPLNVSDSNEQSRRLHPCAAAHVEISSGQSECVAYSRRTVDKASANTGLLELRTAYFGVSADEIVIELNQQKDHTVQTERYRYSEGAWKPISASRGGLANDMNQPTLSLFVKQGLNQPPTLWAKDASTGVSKELWNPNPQFAHISFGDTSVYQWKDATGFEWTGGLVKPVNYVPGERYPLVIQTHGFAESAFMTDGIFPTGMAARQLASEGIMVLQVLGNSEHIGTLQEVTDNVLGYKSAIERLTADGLIDPKRVGIVGFSRTCWYVESALIDEPSLFVAASIIDGVDHSYMQAMLFDPDHTSEGQEIYKAKPFGDGLTEWTKLAPGFHLDRVRAAVLITAITPSSVLQEWETYSSLYQQHKPVDLYYIPEGQHILQKPLERLATQQGTVDWFRFWLQGYERPSPKDADQYERWQHLKGLQDAEKQADGQLPARRPN
jgi:dipeptidyl aminopeptidase/acylaminoacyl peptidase